MNFSERIFKSIPVLAQKFIHLAQLRPNDFMVKISEVDGIKVEIWKFKHGKIFEYESSNKDKGKHRRIRFIRKQFYVCWISSYKDHGAIGFDSFPYIKATPFNKDSKSEDFALSDCRFDWFLYSFKELIKEEMDLETDL